MHKHVQWFLECAAEAFGLPEPVYRFGSAARPAIGDYGICGDGSAGYDFPQWPEDDRLPLADGVARTVVASGVLEQVFHPDWAMDELSRILMPGGTLLIGSADDTGPPTSMPGYWRLTPRSMQRLLEELEVTLVAWQGVEPVSGSICGVGFKTPVDPDVLQRTNRFTECFQHRFDAAGPIAAGRRLKGLLGGWVRGLATWRQIREQNRAQVAVCVSGSQILKQDILKSCLPSDEKTGTRLDLLE